MSMFINLLIFFDQCDFQDVRFQFMNTVRVADKPLHLTYAHARKDNRTTLDGTFVFDPANKVSANYAFGSGNCKVKYTYLHGGGLRTFEPCYDFSKNSWDFSISHKVYEDDVVKASYQTSSSVLNLDWMRNSKGSSSFKVVFCCLFLFFSCLYIFLKHTLFHCLSCTKNVSESNAFFLCH